MNIIQWNPCGIKPKTRNGDIPYLLKEYKSPILVTQETKLPDGQIFKIKGYKSYLKSLTIHDGENAHGGVGIFVKNFASSYQIPLNTTLQAVAVSVKIQQRITICSVYLPPVDPSRADISQDTLQNLINQLPKPFLLLGDFNAHHPLWFDTREVDQRGRTIVELIADHTNDIGLLDGNKPTCLWHVDKSPSHIDLSICSSDLLDTFHWDTHEEPLNSDHFPIILRCQKSLMEQRPPRWNLDKAKWDQYEKLAVLEDISKDYSVEEVTSLFEQTIQNAAEKAIPKTTGIRGANNPAWWNSKCREAISKRNATFRRFNKVSTEENWISYKKARALARRVIINSKKESWIKFIESINNKTPSKEVWRRIRLLLNKYGEERLTTLKINEEQMKISNVPSQAKQQIIEELYKFGCVQTLETDEEEEHLSIKIRYEKNLQQQILEEFHDRIITGSRLKVEVVLPTEPILDEQNEIANCLGRRFYYVSSHASNSKFLEIKNKEENEKLDFSTMKNMKYNGRITEEELDYVLQQSKDSTPGKDEITYSMIKNLGTKGKEQFLYLLNKIFNEGKFPGKWKEAYIIPILKNGKESTDPTAYKPIVNSLNILCLQNS